MSAGGKFIDHHEGVQDSGEADSGDPNACPRQFARIGFAFVAQDIAFCGDDESRRKIAQLIERGAQRRGKRLDPLRGVRHVVIPKPAHRRQVEVEPGFKIPIAGGGEMAIGDGIEQRLQVNLRPAAL